MEEAMTALTRAEIPMCPFKWCGTQMNPADNPGHYKCPKCSCFAGPLSEHQPHYGYHASEGEAQERELRRTIADLRAELTELKFAHVEAKKGAVCLRRTMKAVATQLREHAHEAALASNWTVEAWSLALAKRLDGEG